MPAAFELIKKAERVTDKKSGKDKWQSPRTKNEYARDMIAPVVHKQIPFRFVLTDFAQAREKAHQAACMSGTRQIGMAFSMYVNDYDERTPLINQAPGVPRLRFAFLRPRTEGTTRVRLHPPAKGMTEPRWDGLQQDDRLAPEQSLSFLEVAGASLSGQWPLTITDVQGPYGFGVEQELRLFFTGTPLMPVPRRVPIATTAGGPAPARLEVTSPQTANERYVAFTDRNGRGALLLLPGVTYRVTASRGYEFEPQSVTATTQSQDLRVSLRRQSCAHRVLRRHRHTRPDGRGRPRGRVGLAHAHRSRGALLDVTIGGERPGGSVTATQLPVRVEVESALPMERIDIVHNGKVVHSWTAGGKREFAGARSLPAADGWYLAQVRESKNPVPLAMSNPVFVRKKQGKETK